MNMLSVRALKRSCMVMACAITLSGCAMTGETVTRGIGEEPILSGPPVTRNTTPVDPAFACFAEQIKRNGRRGVRMAVGEVRDLTGKYIEAEGGSVITQGGAHMVMSALGKLDNSIVLVERVASDIAERELAYMDRRQLGDGGVHEVPGEEDTVPWLPYFGGTILRSDYFIVGAITELNWNLSSSGIEGRISGFGGRSRNMTMNVAVDLRIVDTKTMEVVGTTSLQKQITGREVGADVYRFLGDYLFDLNTGQRMQEPVQLAVRTTLELAVLELAGKVTRSDPARCVAQADALVLQQINAEQPAPPRWLPRSQLAAGGGA
ncbi:holdfast attachment protein HfaB [Roseinatronobacter thiooxidans]|uniref:Holdfast attachment protein HfaB n=3 Tax=Roseinatronobacter thiooxidans TaxID=121821 RepID=A0A2W7QPB7_9RHOB|nr:holdfast attachment protein HfaB [Roseinatronobacter thiooxidans]